MEYIDYNWVSYDELRSNAFAKAEQVKKLFYTGLCEGSVGAEFCFVPTNRIKRLEEDVINQYSWVQVVDHEVELCNEVYYTSKIEGAETTIKRTIEIHDGKPVDYNNYFSEMMIKSCFNATKYLNASGNKMDKSVMLKTWNLLVDGCCDNEDIRGNRFRTGEVCVGSHMGLSPSYIEDAIDTWLDYYHSDLLEDHPFIKAAILHLAYEMIHPFCDGNGRSGRLFMLNYLISRGFEKFKAISISRRIDKQRALYDLAFEQSENSYYDCTAFVEYIMSIYLNTLLDINECADP